jgi:hypothetical protein
MRYARERIAVALTFGALVAGGMQGCVSDDSAAPTSPDGGPLLSDSGAPLGNDATMPPVDGASPPLTDGGSPPEEEASAFDAAPPPALVRFAWFVGGTPPDKEALASKKGPFATDGGVPGYDVCVAPHGTGAWIGPLLEKSSFAGGLQPFDVTKYFEVLPGRYDARVVPAGSTTCDLADAGASSTMDAGDDAGDAATATDAGSPPSVEFTSLPALAAGSAITAVLVDPQNPAASIADLYTFSDDTMTSAGKAKLRFVNVSNNLNPVWKVDDAGADAGFTAYGSDFGIGGGALLDTMFANVLAQDHLDPGATNGYREIDPVSGVDSTMLSMTGNQSWGSALATDLLTLGSGGIFTAFYASEAGETPVLIWCYDGVTSASNPLLSKCGHVDSSSDSVLSYTRFGDFSADNDGRDVCVKYHSYGTYVGPLLASNGLDDGGTGIPAQYISSYFNLHGGYEFDARFVNAGSGSCATGVVPDTTFTAFSEPGGGGYTTLALTGYAVVPEDAGTVPPYDAGFDDASAEDAGPQPTSMGLMTLAATVVVVEDESWAAPDLPAIRLIHFAANHPQPLTMNVSGGVVVVGDDDDDDDDTSPVGQTRGFHPLAGGVWELDNVPYGGFSTRPGPTDAFGYELMANGSLDITIAGVNATYDTDNDETTMFAYDTPTGIAILACDDYAEDNFIPNEPDDGQPLYQDCCVLGSPNCGGPQDAVTQAAKLFAHKRVGSRHVVQTVTTKR